MPALTVDTGSSWRGAGQPCECGWPSLVANDTRSGNGGCIGSPDGAS